MKRKRLKQSKEMAQAIKAFLNQKRKTKFQKFLKKHHIKIYWYWLDPRVSFWNRIGIHFFGYGFEISLIWHNFILTWGEE